jgi:hypothetical protein
VTPGPLANAFARLSMLREHCDDNLNRNNYASARDREIYDTAVHDVCDVVAEILETLREELKANGGAL